jgi:hypothetical protein
MSIKSYANTLAAKLGYIPKSEYDRLKETYVKLAAATSEDFYDKKAILTTSKNLRTELTILVAEIQRAALKYGVTAPQMGKKPSVWGARKATRKLK